MSPFDDAARGSSKVAIKEEEEEREREREIGRKRSRTPIGFMTGTERMG
jgi:hypothetical protein